MDKLIEEQANLQDKIEATATAGRSTASSSARWTRCACPRRTPSATSSRAASGAASRCAACCSRSPTSSSSTSPPTTSTPRASRGSSASSPSTRHRRRVTHDRYFLDNVAGWILELDRGQGIPFEGNYSGWLEQKKKRLERRAEAGDARQKTLERELEWVRMAPRARQAKSKARLTAYETLLAEDQAKKAYEPTEIHIPPGPRLGNVVVEARTSRRASATGCSSTTSRSRCRAAASSA
jgi:hypothetical protein